MTGPADTAAGRLSAELDKPRTLWNLPDNVRADLRAVLDEREQLVARVAECQAHPHCVVGCATHKHRRDNGCTRCDVSFGYPIEDSISAGFSFDALAALDTEDAADGSAR